MGTEQKVQEQPKKSSERGLTENYETLLMAIEVIEDKETHPLMREIAVGYVKNFVSELKK